MAKTKVATLQKPKGFELAIIFALVVLAAYIGIKLLFPAHASSQSWHSVGKNGLPAGVNPVDIGTGGACVCVVGSNGYVYKLNGSSWTSMGNAHAVKIAVGPTSIWAVDTAGDIEFWNGKSWGWKNYNKTGPVFDVAVNSDGAMYFTRSDGIYRSDNTRVFHATSAGLAPNGEGGLAVIPGYILWVGGGNYFWYYGTSTHHYGQPTNQAHVRDVGAYDSGHQWFVSTNAMPGDPKNFRLYRIIGSNWTSQSTGGTQISVDQHGNAWLITGHNGIYHWY